MRNNGLAVILCSILTILFACSENVEEVKLGVAETTPIEVKRWRAGEYTNEFGDPTGVRFISNMPVFMGQYSNSATIESPLYAKIYLHQSGGVAIRLYENGLSPNNLKRNFSDKNYTVLIRENGGRIHDFDGLSNEMSIVFPSNMRSKYGQSIIDLLSSSQNLKVHIRGSRRHIEVYMFDIPEDVLVSLPSELQSLGYKPSPSDTIFLHSQQRPMANLSRAETYCQKSSIKEAEPEKYSKCLDEQQTAESSVAKAISEGRESEVSQCSGYVTGGRGLGSAEMVSQVLLLRCLTSREPEKIFKECVRSVTGRSYGGDRFWSVDESIDIASCFDRNAFQLQVLDAGI